jgi:Tol biopolymer transport system component
VRHIVLISFALLGVAEKAIAQSAPQVRELGTLRGLDPYGAYLVPVRGTTRLYYVTQDLNELWMFDRATSRRTRIATGEMWDPAVSPAGDRIAFARSGEGTNVPNEHIWAIPLDPSTGLASGPARRVSTSMGHQPQFSPDGRQIAFAGDLPQDNITVVPATGGVERVVASVTGGISPIQWSPDGRWIYFGLGRNRFAPANIPSLKRVPSNGGAVEDVVSPTTGAWPGLSPDGRLIGTTVGPTQRTVVISDATGKRLGLFAMPAPYDVVWSWTGPTTVLVTANASPAAITIASLVDGSKRRLADSIGDAIAPLWSPDGQRIAFVSRSASGTATLHLMDRNGGSRKAIVLKQPYMTPASQDISQFIEWSPDGRFVSYLSGTNGLVSAFNVVDVVAGTERQLLTGQDARAYWLPDGRRLLHVPILERRDSAVFRREARVLTLDGGSRVLRQFTTNCPACIFPLADSALVIGRFEGTAVVSLRNDDPPRFLLPTDTTRPRSIPAISPDGRLLAFRLNSNDRPRRALEIMRIDGTDRRRVELPVSALAGDGNPVFSPDSKALLVLAREEGATVVFRVSVADGQVTKALTVGDAPSATMRDYSISPDGKSVAYVSYAEWTTKLAEIDVSSIVGGATRR